MEQVLKKEKQIQAKPIMKWAGGKTQMLGDIMPKIPQKYGKYIEPFIGGGALFFALSPDKAIIADSNPELINMYRQVADNVEAVISHLKKYKNTKEDFYEVRSLDWLKLKKEEAAARTIYLNKTCLMVYIASIRRDSLMFRLVNIKLQTFAMKNLYSLHQMC